MTGAVVLIREAGGQELKRDRTHWCQTLVRRANMRGGSGVFQERLVPSGPRCAGHVFGRLAGRVPCRDSEPGRDLIVVAQRTEHQVFNLGVTGSTPVHNDAVA